ncbi:LysE family translocator [Paracoccus aurantiacus]|uniref:LysE family translocator n=1 Tax=Paracoccus aurantiacus TaxID=2599412 RepID=A0A5C6S298_9RHOB|nr:LysE family translocator [Paracoccus aurantiacus]TXB68575.1 LysE family translocator [Paracoccus aurantiacus]
MSWDYLLTAFIVCLAPGIGVVYTLSTTLGGGFRAGLWASVGCTIATVIHMVVAMAGLAAVLHTSAVLFQFIKFAGVAYLLWMAWAVLKDHGGLSIRPAEPAAPAQLVRRGILLNILNPKLPLFFMAFIPQFMPAGAGTPMLIQLGAGFTAMTFAVFMGYVALAATGRQRILSSETAMNWMRRAFAASFALLGLKLATERA